AGVHGAVPGRDRMDLRHGLPAQGVTRMSIEVKPGRYRHFKGKYYDVIGVAKDSESMREVVVYRALYGEHGLWVRPLEMFLEVVERDGMRLPRFEYVGN